MGYSTRIHHPGGGSDCESSRLNLRSETDKYIKERIRKYGIEFEEELAKEHGFCGINHFASMQRVYINSKYGFWYENGVVAGCERPPERPENVPLNYEFTASWGNYNELLFLGWSDPQYTDYALMMKGETDMINLFREPIDVPFTIREHGDGKIQVWRGNNVLRPSTLGWEKSIHADHDFMFFNNIKDAKKAIEKRILREKIVNTYTV
jgi:hypothetical protein